MWLAPPHASPRPVVSCADGLPGVLAMFGSIPSRSMAVLFVLAAMASGQTGNGLQPPPVLTSAISLGGVSTVTGYVDSLPAEVFHIAIYAGPLGDPSAFGESCLFLG